MVRPRGFDPNHLDVRAFANAGAELEGELAQAELQRLHASLIATGETPPPVRWHAGGEKREVSGEPPQTWLHLQASTRVTLACQRCLQPLAEDLAADRHFRFVDGEDEAARLDEESEDDVLAANRAFDLVGLLEDELILALPLVPRHADCPQPLMAPTGEADAGQPNPFAALAALRRPPGGS